MFPTCFRTLSRRNQSVLITACAGNSVGRRFLIFNTYKIAQKTCACMRLHTVHALPDLRVAAGRLRDGVSLSFADPMARGPVVLTCSWLPAIRIQPTEEDPASS